MTQWMPQYLTHSLRICKRDNWKDIQTRALYISRVITNYSTILIPAFDQLINRLTRKDFREICCTRAACVLVTQVKGPR